MPLRNRPEEMFAATARHHPAVEIHQVADLLREDQQEEDDNYIHLAQLHDHENVITSYSIHYTKLYDDEFLLPDDAGL